MEPLLRRAPAHGFHHPPHRRLTGYGLWLEQTDPVRLGLAVEVNDGAWYWRCRKAWLHGVRLPLVLFPQPTAYKCVEDGRYRFQVTFTVPLLGSVLAYGGVLESQPARAAE